MLRISASGVFPSVPATRASAWAGTASCFTSCLSPVQINDTCAVEAESLTYTAPDAGDFSIVATSAAAEGGATRDWMAGATDLAGNPRVYGKAIDIGCYECQSEPCFVFTFR